MKICRSCQQIKPFSEFYKRKQNKDGHRSICKVCWLVLCKQYRHTRNGKATQKRYNQSIKGKVKRKRYLNTPTGNATHRRNGRTYYYSHPEHNKARSAVACAVKIGKIPRPDSLQCSYCTEQAKEYHHHRGYAKKHWLDVVPACQKCHKKSA